MVARRVFLSHTSELRAFPPDRSFVSAAEAAINRIGGAVTDMAYFAVRDARPADYCVRMVQSADIYVGIIGLRYGSPVHDRPDVSYTELEFQAATDLGRPRLIFLLDENAPLPLPAANLIDRKHGDRQEAFRRRLQESGVITAFVASPEQLEKELIHALIELTSTAGGQAAPSPPPPPFMAPAQLHTVVARPDLMDEVISRLSGGSVALTTALRGAGGFGKTTLAAQLCHQVRDRFPGGVLWVTVGQQVAGAALAAKINDLSLHLSGERPTFVDPEQAGHHLGRLLGAERRLLVIDDVWRSDQLEPFLAAGSGCTRLITTRVDSILSADTRSVTVDAMTSAEALSLLTDGLGDYLPDLADLLRRTGRWPVLLRLVNRAIRRWVKYGATVAEAARRVETSLVEGGPAGLDRRHPDALDVFDPQARTDAVSATVEASLTALREGGAGQVERYLELAVFPEDVDVSQATLEVFWAATGGMDARAVERLCLELADLSLVQEYQVTPAPRLRLHDVLLGYLKKRAAGQLPALHRSLLDAHRRLLSTVDGGGRARTAWWTMGDHRYLWSQLGHHLREAGRDGGPETAELEELVCDLRWVVAKLQRLGPPGVDADLALATSAVAVRLRRLLAQNAHLFDALEPSHGLGATLLARLEGEPELAPVVRPYAASLSHPRLAPAWPLPDLPHPAALRVLPGHHGSVEALAISPDGTWLASAGDDPSVRLWSAADGSPRGTLTGHTYWVTALAADPKGRWLASASHDHTVLLSDVEDGSRRARLAAHTDCVRALAVSADGSWLASAGDDGTVRLWSTAGGFPRATLAGHTGSVRALAISRDGAWLASAGDDRAVRIWNADDGSLRSTLFGHTDAVRALAAGSDGTWLASAGDDGTVRLWSVTDGALLATLAGHAGWVRALVASPDGAWLASAGDDQVVRLWDVRRRSLRAALTGHTHSVRALAVSSDGTWLASAGHDRTMRLWSTTGAAGRTALTGHTGTVRALVASPDGAWVASAGDDRTVRLWSAGDGSLRSVLTGHADTVRALAIGPDGAWLASAGHDHTIRIWSTTDWSVRAVLTGHADSVRGLVVGPDGTWLASAGHDHVVRRWSTVDGSPGAVIADAGHSVTALVISPDACWLATGGHDQSVRLWSIGDGALLATLTGHAYSPKHLGQRFSVTALAVSPDGAWLASAGHDRTVQLWSVPDGAPLATLNGHTDSVRGLAFSPDGAWLASAAEDHTVRLWSTSAAACATVLRVAGAVRTCCWLPSPPTRLAVAGSAGVYVLNLVTTAGA